jgi:transposase
LSDVRGVFAEGDVLEVSVVRGLRVLAHAPAKPRTSQVATALKTSALRSRDFGGFSEHAVRNLPDARDEVRIAVKSPKLPELQRSLLNVVVYSAAVQDRDGAVLVLDRRTRRFFPFIKRIFADAAYQGLKTAAAIAKTGRKLEIVKRDDLHLFLVLPKRWIVDRTLA